MNMHLLTLCSVLKLLPVVLILLTSAMEKLRTGLTKGMFTHVPSQMMLSTCTHPHLEITQCIIVYVHTYIYSTHQKKVNEGKVREGSGRVRKGRERYEGRPRVQKGSVG